MISPAISVIVLLKAETLADNLSVSSTDISYRQFLSALQVNEFTYMKYSLSLYFMYIREFSFNRPANILFSARKTREKLTEKENFSSLFSDIYFINASSNLFSAASTRDFGILIPVITNLSPTEGL